MKKIFTTLLLLGLLGMSFPVLAEDEATDLASQNAKVLYAQNEIDLALNILKEKGEDTRSAQDWLLIGNILQDKDRIDEAVYMYQKAIEKDEKYYKAHYNLGYIYLIQEKPNMALAQFKKAVKYKQNFAYGYYNIGCCYLKLKQYGTAKYNFFKAIDIKGDEPSFYYNLAYAYKMMKKEKQAQTYLDIYNKLKERN